MKKHSYLLLAALAVSIAPAALAADAPSSTSETTMERSTDGYTAKSQTQSEDANGTVNAREESVKEKVDSDGTVSKKVESKVTHDPKGLMNKRTDTTTDEVTKAKTGKGKFKHKRVQDGTTTEDTVQEVK